MAGSEMQIAVIKDIVMGVSQCMLIMIMLIFFPLAGIFTTAFLPLPVLFYRLKLGRNNGAIIAAITFGLLFIITGSPGMDLIFSGGLLVSGMFLGECIERQMGISQIMLFSTIGVIGTTFFALILLAGIHGQSPVGLISAYMADYPEIFSKLYQDMGVSQDQTAGLVSLIILILPGMLMTSFLSILLLNILIIKKILAKRGFVLKNLTCLNFYRVPDFLVWLVIALIASLILVRHDSGVMGSIRYISINIVLVLMLIYFFQGIAIVSFFFEKKNIPVPVRIFCYALVILQFYFSILVIGLGFFDHWANFRKIHTYPG